MKEILITNQERSIEGRNTLYQINGTIDDQPHLVTFEIHGTGAKDIKTNFFMMEDEWEIIFREISFNSFKLGLVIGEVPGLYNILFGHVETRFQFDWDEVMNFDEPGFEWEDDDDILQMILKRIIVVLYAQSIPELMIRLVLVGQTLEWENDDSFSNPAIQLLKFIENGTLPEDQELFSKNFDLIKNDFHKYFKSVLTHEGWKEIKEEIGSIVLTTSWNVISLYEEENAVPDFNFAFALASRSENVEPFENEWDVIIKLLLYIAIHIEFIQAGIDLDLITDDVVSKIEQHEFKEIFKNNEIDIRGEMMEQEAPEMIAMPDDLKEEIFGGLTNRLREEVQSLDHEPDELELNAILQRLLSEQEFKN
jgi:hypothetical protein